MRVAVVENMGGTRLGTLGRALGEAGAEVDLFRTWRDGGLPPSAPIGHDALIVLGGPQSALDDAEHPYLPTLAALMRRFGDEGRAVLGVCLGAQLLARGYGAENILGANREFAWTTVEVTPDGAADPLLAGLGERFATFQWHADSFALPEGAVRLASNPVTRNQGFRVGRAAYGAQFHFEADADVVEAWTVEFRDLVGRVAPGWLDRYPEEAARHAADADRAGLAIARAFVRTIRET